MEEKIDPKCRRRSVRKMVRWNARVASKGAGITSGRILNISMTGMYLETCVDSPPGSEMIIQVQAMIKPHAVQMLVKCKIMWRSILSGMRGYGYGLKFIKISAEDQKMIHAVIGPMQDVADDPEQIS